MGFEAPITIERAVNNINEKKYVLPAIQRELVWETSQIEKLFDSIMQEYPIGSFLFWSVDRNRTSDYQFYEFVQRFHERDNRHSEKANLTGERDITAILDGQQRLTALFLGLKGTYAAKLPHKRWDNDLAYPKRRLYLNLLNTAERDDMEFDFRFLTDEECELRDESTFWFKVGNVLDFHEEADVNEYLISEGLLSGGSENSKHANRTLFRLFAAVKNSQIINYYLEEDESLDKVLNIFIRINSGGTELYYSDLLLSIATAQWKKKDAREEIIGFVDEINKSWKPFNFDKDFVLKSCLVLCDLDMKFKVDNFKSENMLMIEDRWEKITESIRLSVKLVSSFGFNRDTLPSKNAVIPIAYYIYAKGNPGNYCDSDNYREDRKDVQQWLNRSLVKKAFSGQPDAVLVPMRRILSSNNGAFPLHKIIEEFRGTNRNLIFDKDEIENLFYYKYGQSYTYSVLSLLYPTLDFSNIFHQDHIYPKSKFTRAKLVKRGIPEEKIAFFLDNVNSLANLQLLEGTPNQEKSAWDLNAWLGKSYSNDEDRKEYLRKHYIPDVDLDISNFEEFINERKRLISNKLEVLLTA